MGDSRVDVRRVGMRGDVRGTAADIDRRAERVARRFDESLTDRTPPSVPN